MLQTRLRASVAHIGQALRDPEGFALRWHTDGQPYDWLVFAALACTAIAGTLTYGLVMGVLGGVPEMLRCAVSCTLAAGIGWSLPLPALYILNSLSGSRLRAGTTFLAALVTTSWGGLAMIASIPMGWFFTIAFPTLPLSGHGVNALVLLLHLAVFSGVGVAMIDVFSRVMERLEPARGRVPVWWLTLVGAIGGELFYAFGLFHFGAVQWFFSF